MRGNFSEKSLVVETREAAGFNADTPLLVLRRAVVAIEVMMMSALQTRIIGLSGQSGVGKTYLARELAEVLKGAVVSFGSYVRAEALLRGKGADRVTLQELGQALIDEYGYKRFVQQVFHFAGIQKNTQMIVDGVRHKEIWQEIQSVEPQSVLIYLHCDEAQRVARLLGRDHLDRASAQAIIEHPMDKNIVQLRLLADLIVSNDTQKGMLAEIIRWLRQKDLVS